MKNYHFISGLLLIVIPLAPNAETLVGGFQYAKPPFIIPDKPFSKDELDPNTQLLGIQLDVARAALKVKGHKLRHIFVTEKRLNEELRTGKLDVAFDVRPTYDNRVYSTEKFSRYENAFVTHKSKNHKVNSFSDLDDIPFVAWQGASNDLGPKFADVVKQNPDYIETPGSQMVKKFLSGHVDGILIDKNIFKWVATRISKQNTLADFDFHSIKELKPRGGLAGFVDEKIRDDFDEGMRQVMSDGTYEKIVDSYF